LYDKGKRKYKSFTSTDPFQKGKRDAELQAAQYAAKKQIMEKQPLKRYKINMDYYTP